MKKHYIKLLFSSFRTIIIYFLLGCIPLLLTFFKSGTYSIEDRNIYYLYFDIFSNYIVTLLILPLFALYIENNAYFFDDVKVIVRFKSKLDWWNKRLAVSAIESLFFTVYTNLLVYFYIVLNGKFKDIDFEFVVFNLKNSLLHFLGYLVAIMCFVIIVNKFKRIYIGVLIILFIFFIDFVFFICGFDFTFILYKMFIYSSYTEDVNINFFVASSAAYLCMVFLVLNFLGYKIIKNSDLI